MYKFEIKNENHTYTPKTYYQLVFYHLLVTITLSPPYYFSFLLIILLLPHIAPLLQCISPTYANLSHLPLSLLPPPSLQICLFLNMRGY